MSGATSARTTRHREAKKCTDLKTTVQAFSSRGTCGCGLRLGQTQRLLWGIRLSMKGEELALPRGLSVSSNQERAERLRTNRGRHLRGRPEHVVAGNSFQKWSPGPPRPFGHGPARFSGRGRGGLAEQCVSSGHLP